MKLTTHERLQLSTFSPARQDELGYADDALWRRFLLGQAIDTVGAQNRVARLLGVFPPHVNRWVKGSRPVPEKYWRQLAKIVDGELE